MDLLWGLCTKTSPSRYCYYIARNSPLVWPRACPKGLIVDRYFSIPIIGTSVNDRNS
jgi:hypothetical protein